MAVETTAIQKVPVTGSPQAPAAPQPAPQPRSDSKVEDPTIKERAAVAPSGAGAAGAKGVILFMNTFGGSPEGLDFKNGVTYEQLQNAKSTITRQLFDLIAYSMKIDKADGRSSKEDTTIIEADIEEFFKNVDTFMQMAQLDPKDPAELVRVAKLYNKDGGKFVRVNASDFNQIKDAILKGWQASKNNEEAYEKAAVMLGKKATELRHILDAICAKINNGKNYENASEEQRQNTLVALALASEYKMDMNGLYGAEEMGGVEEKQGVGEGASGVDKSKKLNEDISKTILTVEGQDITQKMFDGAEQMIKARGLQGEMAKASTMLSLIRNSLLRAEAEKIPTESLTSDDYVGVLSEQFEMMGISDAKDRNSIVDGIVKKNDGKVSRADAERRFDEMIGQLKSDKQATLTVKMKKYMQQLVQQNTGELKKLYDEKVAKNMIDPTKPGAGFEDQKDKLVDEYVGKTLKDKIVKIFKSEKPLSSGDPEIQKILTYITKNIDSLMKGEIQLPAEESGGSAGTGVSPTPGITPAPKKPVDATPDKEGEKKVALFDDYKNGKVTDPNRILTDVRSLTADQRKETSDYFKSQKGSVVEPNAKKMIELFIAVCDPSGPIMEPFGAKDMQTAIGKISKEGFIGAIKEFDDKQLNIIAQAIQQKIGESAIGLEEYLGALTGGIDRPKASDNEKKLLQVTDPLYQKLLEQKADGVMKQLAGSRAQALVELQNSILNVLQTAEINTSSISEKLKGLTDEEKKILNLPDDQKGNYAKVALEKYDAMVKVLTMPGVAA
ncbi:MAG: hypothetical protein WC527_01310 [Candidatus Margulisiibacteriota bacterium]